MHVKECDSLTLTGCLLKKNGADWPSAPKILIDGGKSVLVNGCTFDDTSIGIRIGPGAKRVCITGNLFAEMPHEAIVDDAPAAKKVIANNLTN